MIVLTTGARLHFGLLANPAGADRRFGGVGAMISEPGFRIALSRGEQDEVSGPEPWRSRVAAFIGAFRASASAPETVPPCRLEIQATIPPHVGLGSGTQLGMAVAQGLALLSGTGQLDAALLAARVGRGRRSALGIHGFQQGGLLLEAGKQTAQSVGPLIARAAVPDDWRFVLVRPPVSEGLSGEAEVAAFAALPPMSTDITARLCQLVLLGLWPAVLEADCDAAGDALYEFGRLVGDYFAPAQNGTYADPRMAELVAHWRHHGIRGISQTSWGPTLFALCPSEEAASALVADLAPSRWADCTATIAAPLNHGATIEFAELSVS